MAVLTSLLRATFKRPRSPSLSPACKQHFTSVVLSCFQIWEVSSRYVDLRKSHLNYSWSSQCWSRQSHDLNNQNWKFILNHISFPTFKARQCSTLSFPGSVISENEILQNQNLLGSKERFFFRLLLLHSDSLLSCQAVRMGKPSVFGCGRDLSIFFRFRHVFEMGNHRLWMKIPSSSHVAGTSLAYDGKAPSFLLWPETKTKC